MKRAYINGSIASAALLGVYALIMGIAQGFSAALSTFFELWYFMVPLVVGFGVQVGLYSYVKHAARYTRKGTVVVSAGVSTGSMVACCVHHLADVLPLLGLSAAALFATRYQVPFLVAGVLSNLFGILFMLDLMQHQRLAPKKSFLSKIFRYDMKVVRDIVLVFAIIIIALVFFFYYSSVGNTSSDDRSTSLMPQTNNEKDVTIDVTPGKISFGQPLTFEIRLTTHQGALDYDLTKIAELRDSSGKIYLPIAWEGSPPGGHHRSGVLSFPPVGKTNEITLAIKGVYGVPERLFAWQLS